MLRYEAVDNTSALGGYAGWELIDTHAIPVRTFAVAMPEEDAKQAALALNHHERRLVVARTALPLLRREFLVLAEKYAGTPWENDPAYKAAATAYFEAKATLDKIDGAIGSST